MRLTLTPPILRPGDDDLVVLLVDRETTLHAGRHADVCRGYVGEAWDKAPGRMGESEDAGLLVRGGSACIAVVVVADEPSHPAKPTALFDALERLVGTGAVTGKKVLFLDHHVSHAAQGISVLVVAAMATTVLRTASRVTLEHGDPAPSKEFDGYPPFLDGYTREIPRLASMGKVPSLRSALNSVATNIARKVYSRRLGVFHPSTLGSSCLKRIALERSGACPEPYVDVGHTASSKMNGESERGNVVHEHFQRRLKMAAETPGTGVLAFEPEVKVFSKTFMVAGHADGVIKLLTPFGPQEWIVEIKSTETLPKSVRKKDMMQNIAYMVGLGIPRTIFLYARPGNLDYIEHPYEFDEALFQQMVARISLVDRALASGLIPAATRGGHCRWCGYHALCTRMEGTAGGEGG